VLTLTCAKMSEEGVWILKRVIECGIVIAVSRSDELNADRTRIFLPRESPESFHRCTGKATRAISATTSAAGNQNLSIIEATEVQRVAH